MKTHGIIGDDIEVLDSRIGDVFVDAKALNPTFKLREETILKRVLIKDLQGFYVGDIILIQDQELACCTSVRIIERNDDHYYADVGIRRMGNLHENPELSDFLYSEFFNALMRKRILDDSLKYKMGEEKRKSTKVGNKFNKTD